MPSADFCPAVRRPLGPQRRLGIAERLADCIEDPRAPERVRHGLAEMIRYRALLIAAGYPDGNDCDALKSDPAFKMAVGRLPESGADLCSQPTISRLENLPGTTALKRMMAAMVEVFCDSFEQVPRRLVLDIDDTEDRVHGGQQLALFNAYYDSRCFQPIHIYEATTAKPVASILRAPPSGTEVRGHLRRLVRRIRRPWPLTRITIRGDGHYGHSEVMAWCERKRVGYIFGLAGNSVLLRRVGDLTEDAALGRLAEPDFEPVVRVSPNNSTKRRTSTCDHEVTSLMIRLSAKSDFCNKFGIKGPKLSELFKVLLSDAFVLRAMAGDELPGRRGRGRRRIEIPSGRRSTNPEPRESKRQSANQAGHRRHVLIR